MADATGEKKNSQDITWPVAYAPPCHSYPAYPTRAGARRFCRSARQDGTRRCQHCTSQTIVKYERVKGGSG